MEIFITGTDTDVGKTIVTAGLAATMQSFGYQTGVFKPAQTGCIIENGVQLAPDLDLVNKTDKNIRAIATYKFKEPIAPSLAAELENVIIDNNRLLEDFNALKQKCDFTLVEGAGGLLAPLYKNFLMRDLAKFLNLPTIIVAKPNLGTINHILLTVEAVKSAKIELLGIIISKYPTGTDDIAIKNAPRMIEELSGEKILGIIPDIEEITPKKLIKSIKENVNLEQIFGIKIPKN